MKPTHEQLRELLRVVAATRPQEIDCEQFLTRVAAYLETIGDQALLPELDIVAQHLEVCPECSEEFDALVSTHKSLREEEEAP